MQTLRLKPLERLHVMATSKVKAKTARKPAKVQAKVKATGPAIALAAITPATAINVASGLAKAVHKLERSNATFLLDCTTAAALIGLPITSKQYDRQIAPDVRKAFAAKGMAHLAETTRASYRSRLKTFCLAVNSGLDGMTPLAGETMPVFLARISVSLATSKLKDGRPVWESDGKGKAGRAAGTRGPKAGGANGREFTGLSASDLQDAEGGTNEAPMRAAARILAKGNPSRAARFLIVAQSYVEDFDKWCSTILSEDDKKELAKLTQAATEPTAKGNAKPQQSATGTAIGDKLVEAQAKVNAKAA